MRRPYARLSTTMALGALSLTGTGCLERCVARPAPTLSAGIDFSVAVSSVENVDALFVIDNSNSMAENQANLARNFPLLINQLVSPPVNPATGRPAHTPVKSLHVGVISTDLGTPGSVVPSCANSDTGDDGLLNPIKNGLALRTHQPWTTAPPGRRPTRCTNDPNQYPSFLAFTSTGATPTDPTTFADDFVCNAYLSTGGCGLEQPLEAAYRALVVRNPREVTGNTDPNAGFVRDNAVLAIVMVTDEEDGSVRDCRFAENGVPCTDAVSVFDIMSPDWSSSDLNLRFYMYTPGSRQDPTWPLDRYIDPTRPNRGFTSLKPRRPDLVIFSAIAGVPLAIPTRPSSVTGRTVVDWNTLLGRMADGSDGYTGEQTGSGPVSMRQANADPRCATRVVPACRREGSAAVTTCDPGAQYFAWPSRRVAQVARVFDERYGNGTIASICASDYTPALSQIVERIQARVASRCLTRPLETTPRLCTAAEDPAVTHCAGRGTPVRVSCALYEVLPAGTRATSACTAARGRSIATPDPDTGRERCVIAQAIAPAGSAPPPGEEGFFYDVRAEVTERGCAGDISFTAAATPMSGAVVRIDCVSNVGASSAQNDPAPTTCVM